MRASKKSKEALTGQKVVKSTTTRANRTIEYLQVDNPDMSRTALWWNAGKSFGFVIKTSAKVKLSDSVPLRTPAGTTPTTSTHSFFITVFYFSPGTLGNKYDFSRLFLEHCGSHFIEDLRVKTLTQWSRRSPCFTRISLCRNRRKFWLDAFLPNVTAKRTTWLSVNGFTCFLQYNPN